MIILVTGGAGFIGSNLVRHLVLEAEHSVVNADKLTYAGNLESLLDVERHERYSFRKIDIADSKAVGDVLAEFAPEVIMHLAAESHVDRSIDGPGEFIRTNVIGTFNLLASARDYYDTLSGAKRERFRFLHVSTDEVYGSLSEDDPAFAETTRYDPHSPYSASKASSDHLARAWSSTYGLPVLITNCSNNYGPFQFPEKLIPVVILKALKGEPIPVYGEGKNIRDWLYVEDHVRALCAVLAEGRPGETYNIGGDNELRNIDLVKTLCSILDRLHPVSSNELISQDHQIASYADLITFVQDRPGHDLRYAIDATKIRRELGWRPAEESSSGFSKTVQWYLENQTWWEHILSGEYQLDRQGLGQIRS